MTDILLKQGATFKRTYRWTTPPTVYKTATVTAVIPLTLEATGHGLPDTWPVRILSRDSTPDDSCASSGATATALDPDTIEFNSVIDYSYEIGDEVVISYMTPVDLTGFTAELQLRSSVRAADPLLTISSQGVSPGIVLDNATKSIIVTITAAQSASFSFSNAVFQLELTSSTGDVTRLDEGAATLSKEVVRS